MNEKIKIWMVGDDYRKDEFIEKGIWEIGFDYDSKGFKQYIKYLNKLHVNDIVVLKSKYINQVTKENYLKVYAIGVIEDKLNDKSIKVKWLEKFDHFKEGYKKIENTVYGKTIEPIIKQDVINKIFNDYNDFIKKHNLTEKRGKRLFYIGEGTKNFSQENINYWLIPNNLEIYDAINAFKKLKIIDWGNRANNRFKFGDIVYIYASSPIRGIVLKAEVIQTNITNNELLNNDKDYIKNDIRDINNYIRLKLLNFTDSKVLSLENLQKNGLNGNIQGKRKITGKLLEYVLKNDKKLGDINMEKQNLNQILYGPPGTGKTYSVIEKAVEMIEGVKPNSRDEAKEKFEEYKNKGQIEFITFHQSYSYEDFIEGLKAESSENGNIKYEVKDGIFKSICKKARGCVFYSGLKIDNYEVIKVTHECLHIKKPNGNVVMLPLKYLDELIDLYKNKKITIEEVKNKRAIEKMSKNTEPYIVNGYPNIYAKLIEYYFENKDYEIKNFVLIIDEINRGNISKIFGELITLIEEDKRLGKDEEIKVTLPYSKETFGVPSNLYIIGTMNTADRSIALLDTALRRRFEFVEMMPKPEELKNIKIEDLDLEKMLTVINERIEYLLDRDHTIGHAYFMRLKNIDENKRLDELKSIFKNKIIPLLAEYFYEDWENIDLILNNNGMIREKKLNFISKIEEKIDKKVYEITKADDWTIETFKKIYKEN